MFKQLGLFWKQHAEKIYRALLFICTVVVIVYIFPREGKFQYEFQWGRPWMHADIVAPFDFPVRKSEKELKFERDSILREFKPYFTYRKDTYLEQEEKFNLAFESRWKTHISRQSASGIQLFRGSRVTEWSARKEIYFKVLQEALRMTYAQGILPVSEMLDSQENKSFSIVIIRDNIGEEFDNSEVFTQKSAYEYINASFDKLKEDAGEDERAFLTGFFRELSVNEFVQPNLVYNEEASNNVKAELIREISPTKGIVQANHRLISKGEIVNEEKFMILESLKHEYENKLGRTGSYNYILVGHIILVVLLVLLLFLFLIHFRREVYFNHLKITFIILLLLLMVVISGLVTKYDKVSLYIIPFVIVPVMIRTFYDPRMALFVHMIAILLVGFIAPNSFEFVLMNFMAGVVAILSLSTMYRRIQLFNTAFLVTLTYCLVYFAISVIHEGTMTNIRWIEFVWFLVSGLLLMSSYPLIFIFEKMFGFLSDVTLMELSDTNQPLLRKLSEIAPGTFQHSLQVANLAEEAAIKVEANPMLVRTGALYHDIGKMDAPMYFIENLSREKNPHDELTFEESAAIIIGHVDKGVVLAKKHGLPEQLIDFIRTHHGTTTVQFFYRSFIKQNPEVEPNKGVFTYPGPKPFSKEMAIVMMADSVEAASRSLNELTESGVNMLVDNIINYQMIEEQYNDAHITYRDITTIKKVFKEKLKNIYHVRIKYPEP